MRLACWGTDGVRGRKLEMEQFLSEHSVDICLLKEMHLKPGLPQRYANYGCQVTDSPLPGGAKATLDRNSRMCQSFFRRHLEDTAIHLVSTTRPKKLVSAYLSPTKTLIESDRNECLSGGFLVLMAFEVNENCSVMNSILIRDQNMLLRIYANKNSWLMR